MKLFLVMSEARFYHPQFVAEFLIRTKDEIVGAALVTKTPPKGNLELYLIKHFYFLKPLEILKLIIGYVNAVRVSNSVRSAYERSGIDYFEVENNINQKKYLDKIKKVKPDVIISSNTLYFKKELLDIPKICSLNRHSALLPKFGGLWPVFQAVRSGEKYTGVSVHLMTKEIDKGKVLAQKKIKISKNQTVAELYELTFRASADVLLRALEKVRKKDFSSVVGRATPSYYSFPTALHWEEFRVRGGKFI